LEGVVRIRAELDGTTVILNEKQYESMKVKSRKVGFPVIQAKAGIQYVKQLLDTGVRRHDAFATFYRFINLHRVKGFSLILLLGRSQTSMMHASRSL
jgi:hypothetical protein